MKTTHTFFILLLITTAMYLSRAEAQVAYVLSANPEVMVSGTSTLHDWEIKSSTAEGKANFTLKDQQLQSISSLSFAIPAESLKSGKNGMDNNTYKALKSKSHPEITFVLTKIKGITQKGSKSEIDAVGNLTIAGVTHSVEVKVTSEISDNHLVFSGKKALKMTDFNIEPPVALMGTVKTGDAIEINFKIKFQTKLS